MQKVHPRNFETVWSATPTPFTTDWKIDHLAVEKLVQHHIRLGVRGLFLAGTCGEGAWMRERERRDLLRTAREVAGGELLIALQVTDNSAHRILDNIDLAREDGADVVVIAPPQFVMNPYPHTLRNLYQEAIRGSSLPVCLYDLGERRQFSPTDDLLAELYCEPNLVAVKDSSSSLARRDITLRARAERPDLRLMAGDEFACAQYLLAGYDGLMLGGAAFHGHLAVQLLGAVLQGDGPRAELLQERMDRMMYAAYGGKDISCWLGGEKKLLMELGVFHTWHNYPGYWPGPECEAAIRKLVLEERAVLLP